MFGLGLTILFAFLSAAEANVDLWEALSLRGRSLTDNRCQRLQEVGRDAVEAWIANEHYYLAMVPPPGSLSEAGWGDLNEDDVNSRLCHIAHAKTVADLAAAVGVPYVDFLEWYEQELELMAEFGGAEGMYSALTAVRDVNRFLDDVNYSQTNPRPDISASAANQFVDEMFRDHGGDFFQQLVRFLLMDDVTITMDPDGLAKAITDATSVQEFSRLSGVEQYAVDVLFSLIDVMRRDPSLVTLLSTTAQFVRVAADLGLYALQQ